MYCPRCRTKRIDELLVCPDCDVSLECELPPGQKPEFSNFSSLYAPTSSSELLMIKSILAREDINYYTTNDKYNQDIELNKGCVIMVQDGHIKKARQVLSDYNIYLQNQHNIENDRSSFNTSRKVLKNFIFGWVPKRKKD